LELGNFGFSRGGSRYPTSSDRHQVLLMIILLARNALIILVGMVLLVASCDEGTNDDRLEFLPVAASELDSRLISKLKESPFNYFRFVNRNWSHAVCDEFQDALGGMPDVALHGDAHLGQYALTDSEHGLDDFDDAASGPAVMDMVRFLGSVELVARRRGWADQREHLFDEFFRGYKGALKDPDIRPPVPSWVHRTRSQTSVDRQDFLDWAESLMIPFNQEEMPALEEAFARFTTMMMERRPDLPTGYFRVKKAGWLRIGIGSALTPKQLARFEGPTDAPEDDFIMEGKELSDLTGVNCIRVPESNEASRVIETSTRMARIRHDILAVVPQPGEGPERRGWWARTWDHFFQELDVDRLVSAEELAEIVFDSGAQLGVGHCAEPGSAAAEAARFAHLKVVNSHEAEIRDTAIRITEELIREWESFR
jgi:hypothetical protein